MTIEEVASRVSLVKVRQDEGVVTIVLARPDRLNALGPDMLPELLDVLEAVRTSRELKALVLTAEGRALTLAGEARSGSLSVEMHLPPVERRAGASSAAESERMRPRRAPTSTR